MRMYYMARTSEGFKNIPLELSNQEWCLTIRPTPKMGMHRDVDIWTSPTGDFTRFHRENGHLPPPKWHKPSTVSLRSPKHSGPEWCFQPAPETWLMTQLGAPIFHELLGGWTSTLKIQPVSWDHSRMANINPPTSGWIKTCGTTSLLVVLGIFCFRKTQSKRWLKHHYQ